MLQLGRSIYGAWLELFGDGDAGDLIVLEDGREVRRLDALHRREIQNVFGLFELMRAVYGTREGQKIEAVPLDERLQLPQGKNSYLLQDWDQGLAVEMPYEQVNTGLARILGFTQSVHTLERNQREMATAVDESWKDRPIPPAEQEGALMVGQARIPTDAPRALLQIRACGAGARCREDDRAADASDVQLDGAAGDAAQSRRRQSHHRAHGRPGNPLASRLGVPTKGIQSLRWSGTHHKLKGKRRETLARICGYFHNNIHRMAYDVYLENGFPIASGVIEGACRCVVKDRMERAGMRWVMSGASAMLHMRSIHLSGLWEEFTDFRMQRESRHLCPGYAANDPDFSQPLAA